jgi:hypothetical protein
MDFQSAQRSGPSNKFDPYRTYLAERWHEGCHNAAKLYTDIAQQGYTGCKTSMYQCVRGWRQNCSPEQQEPPEVISRTPSVRRVCNWLLERGIERLTDDQKQYVQHVVQQLCQKIPQIALARQLSLAFVQILKCKLHKALPAWLRQAQASGVSAL